MSKEHEEEVRQKYLKQGYKILTSRGVPDVIAYDKKKKIIKFVEVKGPNDGLSTFQLDWKELIELMSDKESALTYNVLFHGNDSICSEGIILSETAQEKFVNDSRIIGIRTTLLEQAFKMSGVFNESDMIKHIIERLGKNANTDTMSTQHRHLKGAGVLTQHGMKMFKWNRDVKTIKDARILLKKYNNKSKNKK